MHAPGWLTLYALHAVLAGPAIGALAAQETHQITLEGDRKAETYRFSPASVTARPGDVLHFKVVSGGPHNIVFEASGLSAQARGALNAALSRRTADLTGPLLVQAGAEYRVVLPDLPTGTYRYYCLPHRAYDERGQIVVKK